MKSNSIWFGSFDRRISDMWGAVRYQRAELPLKLNGFGAAREFFAGCLADGDPTREALFVAHVDSEARCIHLSTYPGDETETSFPLRSIIIDAALHSSAAIVLAHNHPSGDPRPSYSDCRATRHLATAVEALDCAVLDHLIFGGTECTSFRHLGLL